MKHLVLFLLLGAQIAYSQQDPQFTQFQRNRLLDNPGFTGMNGRLCMGSSFRSQWTGFNGAPQTINAWISAYVPELRGGIAFHITRDVLGLEKNTRLLGSYSLHRVIGSLRMGAGVSANIQQKSLNGTWIAVDGTGGDNSIPSPASQDWLGGLDAGLWLHGSRVYAGISATQINQGTFRDGTVAFKNTRHYFVNAGTRFHLPDPSFELRIHFLGKTDARAATMDVLSECWWNDMLFAGGGWRPGDAFLLSAGARWSNITLGYSYDITSSSLRNHSSNTHEISIRICCRGKRICKTETKENPRFMWGDRFSGPPQCIEDSPGFNIDW